jgi:hypothetical protein
MARTRRPGRRREPLDPAKTAIVELGHEMRQQRLAADVDDPAYVTDSAETWIPGEGVRDRSAFVNDANVLVDGQRPDGRARSAVRADP